MPIVRQETIGQNSDTTYKSLLIVRVFGRTKCSFTLANTSGTNGIKWKLLCSNASDGKAGSWAEEKSEATLNPNSTISYAPSGVYGWYDLQIIDASSGNHAACSAWFVGVGI